MKKILWSLLILVIVLSHQFTIQAQTTGSIGGTVVDSNGAVLPNASITIKGQSGQSFPQLPQTTELIMFRLLLPVFTP